MNNIISCTSSIPNLTYISNTFIDTHMLSANGSYVKVYLYLLRCIQSGEMDLSVSSLAQILNCTEKDIIIAFLYWEKKQLLDITLSDDGESISTLKLLNPDASADVTAQQTVDTVTLPSENSIADDTARWSDEEMMKNDIPDNNFQEISTDIPVANTTNTAETEDNKKTPVVIHISKEQSERLAEDEEFVWTCHVIESYLERPLKPNEVQLISYLYDDLKFSTDLLLYLYEYCISLGKTNSNYIQTVAISWDEQNVKTPEEAKIASVNFNATYTAISKAFALGRPLAIIEKQFVDRWQNEWELDLSVILDACNRTMLKLQKADFKYTEGILDNWHKANVHTIQDVEKIDEVFAQRKAEKQAKKAAAPKAGTKSKNQFNSFQQRGATQSEVDALEKKLLMH